MIKHIKGWFTNKNKQIELDKTSNINSIGVARNVDIKKIIDRITQIENTLNNLPPPTTPPDLTPYALKNTNNEFTEPQSIKNDASFWEFKNNAGRRIGYVGKPSSNSNTIGLVNENGDTLVKSTGDVKLEVGSRNGVIGERAPTANNHLTNKKYVDDKITETRNYTDTKIRQEIDAIPPLDLTDFASLTQDNQFTGNNQFNNGVNFQNATNLNGDAKYFGNVTENKHVATKEYVDSKSAREQYIAGASSSSGYSVTNININSYRLTLDVDNDISNKYVIGNLWCKTQNDELISLNVTSAYNFNNGGRKNIIINFLSASDKIIKSVLKYELYGATVKTYKGE